MGLTHKTETSLDDLFSKFAVEPKEKNVKKMTMKKKKTTKIKKKSNR